MPFIVTDRQRDRPTDGNPEAKILIVGDCPDGHALKEGKPFAGPHGSVLETALHQAGLLRFEVLVTNLIWDDKNLAKYWKEKTNHKGPNQLVGNIRPYQDSLLELITGLEPDIVVACGELSMFALTGQSAITKLRGYPVYTAKHNIRVIPSLHPRQMIWSNYVWRYYLAYDLKKAKQISEDPSVMCPAIETIIPKNFDETMSWLTYFDHVDRVSFDIEVSNYETSCVGFSDHPCHGVSIPLDMRWTEEEEVCIRVGIAAILENPNIVKIAQNGIFDAHFMGYKDKIFVGPLNGKMFQDTMMAHSIMYPDFLKGLNFLGSAYTMHPYWKDELDVKTIKDES